MWTWFWLGGCAPSFRSSWAWLGWLCFLNIYAGAPLKGKHCPGMLLSWHTAQVQEKVETHDALPPLLTLLAKGGCRAKANVKDWASALFLKQETAKLP